MNMSTRVLQMCSENTAESRFLNKKVAENAYTFIYTEDIHS